jgi:preprotein translocase subunit SecE
VGRPVPARGGTSSEQQASARRAGNRIMAKTNPLQFIQQVRQEAEKVTWPTRRETLITTIMVMIMVTFAAIFFLTVDAVLSRAVNALLLYGI